MSGSVHDLSGPALLAAGAAAATAVVACWWAYRPIWAWRHRTLPGPPRLPLLGNLVDIIKSDVTLFMDQCARKYGGVCVIWQGSRPFVLITDPDLARRALMKVNVRPDFTFTMVVEGEHLKMSANSALFIKGNLWRVSHKAFEAAVMLPRALAAQTPHILNCIDKLVSRLQRVADSGQPCDVNICLSDMTMDVIGAVAFGLELGMTEGGNAAAVNIAPGAKGTVPWWEALPTSSPAFGQHLVACAREIFRYADMKQGTRYRAFTMLLPPIAPIIRWVANRFPDDRLKADIRARDGLTGACRRLIAEWRTAKNEPAPAGAVDHAGKQAIRDNGFLARMMSGKGLAADEMLSELDVISQAISMLLAGYETTASALSACLHLLSLSPAAQARAQQELDTVLQGRSPSAEQLEQLPYCCAVLDEALRLLPPAAMSMRVQPQQDWDLGEGRRVPAGASIWLHHYSMHHDPAIWPRAEEFLPQRHLPGQQSEGLAPSTPHAYMPFGHGARMCVGYKLALLEARLALATLLQHFSFAPAEGCPAPKFSTGIVFTSHEMWLSVTRRQATKADAVTNNAVVLSAASA